MTDSTINIRDGQWREIPGFYGYYAHESGVICSGWYPTGDGRRYNKNRLKLLKPRTRKNDGYCTLTLISSDDERTDVYVHVMVLLAFVGTCPDGMETLHDDGDRSNNTLKNLRYGTRLENAQDRIRHGTGTRGETHNTTKLTEAQVRQIKHRIASGEIDSVIAKDFPVTRGQVYNIRVGSAWGWTNE